MFGITSVKQIQLMFIPKYHHYDSTFRRREREWRRGGVEYCPLEKERGRWLLRRGTNDDGCIMLQHQLVGIVAALQ